MAGYTPVFRSILQSTIWEEQPHVKVVWWTMLLMCDRNGFVETTIPGLARSAVVTREQCIDALNRLSSPDPDSKTKTNGGRRIVQVEDGWTLVNHQKYKDKVGISSQSNRERVARCRAAKKEKDTEEKPLDSNTSIPCNACNGESNDLDPKPIPKKKEEEIPIPVATVPAPKKKKVDMRSMSMQMRAADASVTGDFPADRPGVTELHEAWRSSLRMIHKLTKKCGEDAFYLADAIEDYGIAACLLVAKYAPQDGMVNGSTDRQKEKHNTIRYIFGNPDTFSRILTNATEKEPVPGAPTQSDKLSNAYAKGRF